MRRSNELIDTNFTNPFFCLRVCLKFKSLKTKHLTLDLVSSQYYKKQDVT